MRHALGRIGKQLALALKHCEHSSRNLQYVHLWAVQNDEKHLEQGSLGLMHQASRLTGDLATLISVLAAQEAKVADSD